MARSIGGAENARPENDGQRKLWVWKMQQNWKMTDKILANSRQNYGVWKIQDWKMTDHVNSRHKPQPGNTQRRVSRWRGRQRRQERRRRTVQLRQPQQQLMPRRRGRHVKSASWLRVTASCWCLAGTRVSVLSVLTPGPLCQMAVRCVVHLLTWLCVCIFDVYLANYRKTLLELD